jgi:HPt (histidine-containing phosphotransfer) domain-containing protein
MSAGDIIYQTRTIDVGQGPSLVPEQPIDFDQLARTSGGQSALMRELLRTFSMQADLLLARIRSEAPSAAAARAHVLASSARAVGARKVADCAAEFEDAAHGSRPISLNPAMRHLSAAVIEAQEAISSYSALNSALP